MRWFHLSVTIAFSWVCWFLSLATSWQDSVTFLSLATIRCWVQLKSETPFILWRLFFFFDVDHFKVFIEFVMTLFYILGFWSWVIWDLSFPTGGWICTPCTGRQSFNHWTAREVPETPFMYPLLFSPREDPTNMLWSECSCPPLTSKSYAEIVTPRGDGIRMWGFKEVLISRGCPHGWN